MATTTWRAIRQQMATTLRQLALQELTASRLRLTRNESDTDFRAWAEGHDGALLREYEIELVSDVTTGIQDHETEVREATCQVVVAYPHQWGIYDTHNADTQFNSASLRAMIDSDLAQIRSAIGVRGSVNYADGQYAAVEQGVDIDVREGISFGVTDLTVTYRSAVSAAVVSLPGVPTLSVSAGDAENVVTVSTPTGAQTLNLYFGLSAGVTPGTGTKIADITSPYTHTGRTNGVEVFYVATAENVLGEGDPSAEDSGTPQISAPTNLVATAGEEQVTLTWGTPAGADSVNLRRGTATGTYDTTIEDVTSPYTDTGLTGDVEYFYAAQAIDGASTSALSNEDSATPTSAASAVDFPTTVAEWATLSSEAGISLGAPSYIWMFDEASGSVVDEVTGLTLAPTGTIEYQQVPSAFVNEFGATITLDTTDRFQGSTSDLNPGTGSFFAFIAIQFPSPAAGGANRTIVEKFGTGVGFTLLMDNSGFVTLLLDDGTNEDTLIADAGSHAGTTQLIGFGRNQTTGRALLLTGAELLEPVRAASLTLNNSGPFRFGRFSSAGMAPLFYSAWWFGAACESVTSADWTAYATHLGLV